MKRPVWFSVSAEHRAVLLGHGRRVIRYLREASPIIALCSARGRQVIQYLREASSVIASYSARGRQLIRHHLAEASPVLEQCAARWQALASRADGGLMRAVVAFTVSFVVVVTVGLLVLPDTPPRLRSKLRVGPVPAVPSFTLTPRMPSHSVPRKDTPSRYYEDAASLSAEIKTNAGQELKAGSVSKASNGLRQATAVVTRPGGDVRGGIVRVTGITLWGTSNRPWVSITASGPVRYQLRNVEPDWVVVDISRAQLAVASDLPAGRGLVKQIRTGQFAPDVVRVVVELTGPISAHIATSLDKTAIVVSLAAQARGNGRMPSRSEQQFAGDPASGFPQSAVSPPPAPLARRSD